MHPTNLRRIGKFERTTNRAQCYIMRAGVSEGETKALEFKEAGNAAFKGMPSRFLNFGVT